MANFVSPTNPPPDLEEKFKLVAGAATSLGAHSALTRLKLVWDNSKTLSTEIAYRWIDPASLIAEIEEIQMRPAGRCRQWSNLVAILPIILSWFSLAYAMFSYQHYLLSTPKAVEQPFIQLWQDGFGGKDPYSLSVTALVAALILIFYVILLGVANTLEARAQRKADNFATLLQSFLSELDRANFRKPATLPPDADLPQVTDAIQNSITQAIETSSQVVSTAQADLEALLHTYREHEETLNTQTTKAVAVFQEQLNDLRPTVTTFAGQVSQITPLFQDLTRTTAEMAKSFSEHANRYTHIGTELDLKIPLWTEAQQRLTSQLKDADTRLAAMNDAIQANTYVIANAQAGLENVLHAHRTEITTLNGQTTVLVSDVTQMLKKTVEQLESLTTTMNRLPAASLDLLKATEGMAAYAVKQTDTYTEVSRDLMAKIATFTEVQQQLKKTIEQLPAMVRDITQEIASAYKANSTEVQPVQPPKRRSWWSQLFAGKKRKKTTASLTLSPELEEQTGQKESPTGQGR